jgi:hypothetical protein
MPDAKNREPSTDEAPKPDHDKAPTPSEPASRHEDPEDGDMATPKQDSPTEDDAPLE